MKQYIKKNMTKEWLLKNDFRYNRFFSTKDDTVYTQRFTVAKQCGKHDISLECEVLAYYPEGNICINVYNAGTRDKYPSFYNREFGSNNNKLLDMIDFKINKKLERLEIEVIKDGNDYN